MFNYKIESNTIILSQWLTSVNGWFLFTIPIFSINICLGSSAAYTNLSPINLFINFALNKLSNTQRKIQDTQLILKQGSKKPNYLKFIWSAVYNYIGSKCQQYTQLMEFFN